jgi:PAS domain S-box-containing protein
MTFYREKFRELRKKLRWSIKALAEASDISRESISKWENGQRIPSANSLYILAKTIGVRVGEISDLDDIYPKSESKVLESTIIDNGNLLDTINNEENLYLNNILANLQNMNNNLKRVSNVLKTILLNVNNIIYIKDTDQKYVLVSKAFLDNCSLKVDYISKGKTDKDFFPNNEADINTKEDSQIFTSGTAVINTERHIPGSRKRKWGIFNKIPILDNEKKMKGLLCVIVDISDRKREEKYSKILEYAISQSNTTIWVGRGINLSELPRISKEIVYWRRSENNLFWGDTDVQKYSDKELCDKWFSSISEKTKNKFIKEKKEFKYPKTRYYYATSPFNGNRVWIKEKIFFDRENETFVGLITEDSDSLQLNLLSNIINSMSNIIVWSGYLDSEGKLNFNYLNNTSDITGYSSEDFIDGKISFTELAVDEHKALFHCIDEETNYPISFEFKIQNKNGSEHWLKGNFFKENKFEESEFDIYFGYYVDVSEEKYLEESYRELKFKELGI